MPRTVTIHAITNNLVGDETYEAWLKHEADAWALVDAGDVEQLLGSQDFVFPGLIDGDDYSLQLRMKRTGRYRVGYLSADPNSWPAQSRIDFTPGSLIGVSAPALTVDNWVRTSAIQTKFVVHITPSDVGTNLELIDNGVLVHTFVAPLASPIVYDVLDPTAAIEHNFRARHIAGTLGGPLSPIVTKFAGPAPVINLVQTSDPSLYNDFTIAWEGAAGPYRVENNEEFVANTSAQEYNVHIGLEEIPPGSTAPGGSIARVRREVVTFGVTDVSAWEQVGVSYEVDA